MLSDTLAFSPPSLTPGSIAKIFCKHNSLDHNVSSRVVVDRDTDDGRWSGYAGWNFQFNWTLVDATCPASCADIYLGFASSRMTCKLPFSSLHLISFTPTPLLIEVSALRHWN